MNSFNPKVKLFLDGADREMILNHNNDPLVKGFTTNPSLMRKAGVNDYKAYCLELLKTVKKPISFEVFADDFAEMKKQALLIKTWGENVYVKIPVMNSKGETSYKLVHELAQAGIKLNVTAIFTFDQVMRTCEALKGGADSIVSVFAGRIADTGVNPEPLMKASSEVCRYYGKNIELLWASNREFYNIVQAEECGCHIITITPDVYKKRSMYMTKPEALSLDTVQTFLKDSTAAGFKIES